jgi:GntR family transcriptional regulator, rspAB operon transcriptional repressor
MKAKDLDFKEDSAIWLKVYEYLRDKILSGEIAPNERLVEASIAKEIGTSRTPVREALHNMQKEGLVESIPRVGYRVRPITEEEVSQVCRIRALLETLATEWAIQRGQDSLLRELDDNLAASEEALAHGNIKAFVELDAEFHDTITRLSKSSHIEETVRMMRRHMFRFRMESFYFANVAEDALKGHKAIVRAIRTRSATEIGKAIDDHLELALRAVLKVELGKYET